MKKMLMMGGLSALAFGAALGASWYMQKGPAEAAATQGEHQKSVVAQENGHGEEHAVDAHVMADPHQPSSNDTLPAAVRPRSASVEELVRLGLSLNEREQQLKVKEEQLEKQALHQELALADIATEQQALNGLRTAIDGHLDAAEKVLAEMQVLQEQTAQERAQLAQQPQPETQAETGSAHQDANIKRLSQWLQGMEATKAAELLQEMANEGELDTAVKILSNFEERQAAKLLSSIDDATLLNELVTKFRDLKTSKPTTKR